MHWSWERSALQQAADQVVVRKDLKVSGIAATIFGVLALFAGVLPPLDPMLLTVGAALALAGLWNLTNPSALGLALNAGTLILLGVYNVGAGFVDAANGIKPFVGWQVLGVWQVIWGVQAIGRHRRFRDAFAHPVTPDQLAQAKALVDDLRKSPPKKAPDVIEWVETGFAPKLARTRLMQDLALVLVAMGDDVRVVPRAALDIECPELKPRGFSKAVVRRDGVERKAEIREESVHRFRTWKQSSVGLQQKRAA